MGLSKILIKNLRDSKATGGTAPKKKLMSFLKNVIEMWTVMQRCVYQRQIDSVDVWCCLEQLN